MSAMWSRLRRRTPKRQPQPPVPSRAPCLICMDLDLEADDRNPLISDIHHSAKLGCTGCSVLDVLLTPYKHETSDTSQIRIGQSSMTESSYPMGRNLRLDNLPSSPSRLEVFTSRGELRILVPISINLQGLQSKIQSHLRAPATMQNHAHKSNERLGEPCPWHSIRPCTEISGDTSSEQALLKVREWIDECSYNHPKCKSSSETKLPTRLIQILAPKRIRLLETSGQLGQYTCLSHCWGSRPLVKTTTTTIKSYQDEIPWSDLPKNFEDAIEFSNGLGVEYVWIDSLCIIQDDTEDWRREASKMAEIYENSYLTIAASKSSDSSGGCFAKASPSHLSRTHTFWNSQNEKYKVHCREPLEHRYPKDSQLPLFTRGWVFQEQILSPRFVHFAPQEMFWECMTSLDCECSEILKDLGRWTPKSRLLSEHFRLGKYDLDKMRQWHQLVEEYSRRELTFEMDVFPAIQGIARLMQRTRKSEYLAGLWKDSLTTDLLWLASSPSKRPEVWRSPTWGWASVKGRVSWYTRIGDAAEPFVTILDVKTMPTGSDEFGELVSGELRLLGNLASGAILHEETGSASQTTLTVSLRLDCKDGEGIIVDPSCFKRDYDFMVQDKFYVADETPVRIMRMASFEMATIGDLVVPVSQWKRTGKEFWLVLRCIDDKAQIFERIGAVIYDDRISSSVLDLFGDGKERSEITVM